MEIKQAFILMVLAFGANLLLRCMWNVISLVLTGKWHSHISSPMFNNKGETATADDVKFDDKQQKAVDAIVQERLARERSKFGDYEDLKKFKSEHEKALEQKSQEELVKAKKYEEAENTYKNKINEYNGIVTKKDQEIIDLKKEYHLSNEISKNNGYIEESIALLKNQTILDANGNVKIKGKDANGIDVEMPLSEGVKKFYEQRPHLMKSTHKAGAGTGAVDGGGAGGGAGSGQGEDLNSLNAQLLAASKGTDLKKISEIKQKIKTTMAEKGHRR